LLWYELHYHKTGRNAVDFSRIICIRDESFQDSEANTLRSFFQQLIHHHIGGSGQAMPIPVGLHPGSGGIHNIEKQYGIWGGVDDSVFSELLQSIKSMTIRTKKWKNVRIK